MTACALVAVVALPRLYDRLYERLIYKNEYDGTQRFAQIVETRSGVITVAEDGSVYGGGATTASSTRGSRTTTRTASSAGFDVTRIAASTSSS